jgi:hypothetical protein
LAPLAAVGVLFRFKKAINFFSISLVAYLGILAVTPIVYDRYFLMVVPLFILFVLSLNSSFGLVQKVFLFGFNAFLLFYVYQFSMDFVLSNQYVWQKSVEMVHAQNLSPEKIQGTNAWKLLHRNIPRDYLYEFSFDDGVKKPKYVTNFRLVETHKVEYPLNFFIEPKIFLYQKIQ